jgi:hypothetical protein
MTRSLQQIAADWLGETWDYRPSAFWFWNSDMKPSAIEHSLEEMVRNQIREVIIHPIHGMEIEYLSTEYFDRYRYALELMRKHDLKAWIYDEYGWPSGNAGGMLLRQHPEHRGWYLRFRRDEKSNICADPMQSDRILDNVMGASWTRNETGYLDTLSCEAVRCFIELTHERYYRECGEYFGKVVTGFFTDEPVTMVDINTGVPSGWYTLGVPWTPALPKRFHERLGYEIEPHYTQLADATQTAVRKDYWHVVKEMHHEAYYGQISRWCQAHDVKLTGHIGEDSFPQQVRFAADPYQALKTMDVPGIDFLGYGWESDVRFGEQTFVASVARHSGKKRVLSESFGISPFSIRLGSMLGQIQMMGLHGINDFALMGFHQSLDGMRKYLYWPPLFHQSPWWPFYPVFRDAVARAVGLTTFGERRSRYAIIYPQCELEQVDPWNVDLWQQKDNASEMINRLGAAIYEMGETFEFVFSDVLDQAKVIDGKIIFPNAEYEAIVAPAGIRYFDQDITALERIAGLGGTVLMENIDSVEEIIRESSPSGNHKIKVDAKFGKIRLFWFIYPDGEMLVLRNVSQDLQPVTITSTTLLTQWDPLRGRIENGSKTINASLTSGATVYLSISEKPISSHAMVAVQKIEMDEEKWQVLPQQRNTIRLNQLRFRHDNGQWYKAVPLNRVGGQSVCRKTFALPDIFFNQMDIPFEGSFECEKIPGELGIIFEETHLADLCVNGHPVGLNEGISVQGWDVSCRHVEIRDVTQYGINLVSGTLKFQEFETSTFNHTFYANKPLPGCNLALAGDFRFVDNCLIPTDNLPLKLPINLFDQGWSQYHGIIEIKTQVFVNAQQCERINGIDIKLIAPDALEVLLDGNSLGQGILPPYQFKIEPKITAGKHVVTLRVAGTSANLLEEPTPWGVAEVNWLGNGEA